jgi:DNA-binding GntR family transcriptional regulator
MAKRVLRDEIYSQLVDRLVFTRLPEGSKVHDFELARDLGVSRTPIREALVRLQNDGLITAEANQGFSVKLRSVEEVAETYPIIAALEGLAFSTCDIRGIDAPGLRRLNTQLRAAKNAADATLLDTRFHEHLLEPSPNQRLRHLLKRLKCIVQRYEYVYMRDSRLVHTSWREHEEIIRAVEKGEHGQAAQALQHNWTRSQYAMLRFLRSEERN